MKSPALSALLAVAVAIAFGQTTADAHHTGRAKKHRMTFEFASVVAVGYWAKRGLTIPCHPHRRLLTRAENTALQEEYRAAGLIGENEGIGMTVDVPSCMVNVTPDLNWYRTQTGFKWIYCQAVTHELGHLAGLGHDYGGIMDFRNGVVPWGCKHPLKFRRRLAQSGTTR
jgi:hypothetical protein